MGASTIHALFDLDGAFQSRLDFARFDNLKVKALLDMQVLLLDEVSMLDVEIWTTIVQILVAKNAGRTQNQSKIAK